MYIHTLEQLRWSYVAIRVCTHVGVYMCGHVSACVYMYGPVWMFKTCVPVWICVSAWKCMYGQLCMARWSCVVICVCTRVGVYMCGHVSACVYMYGPV